MPIGSVSMPTSYLPTPQSATLQSQAATQAAAQAAQAKASQGKTAAMDGDGDHGIEPARGGAASAASTSTSPQGTGLLLNRIA